MGNVSLAVGSSNHEFLPEFRQMEEHSFEFIGHSIIKEGNGLKDAFDKKN